jgi:hypothetical protein
MLTLKIWKERDNLTKSTGKNEDKASESGYPRVVFKSQTRMTTTTKKTYWYEV